MTLPTLYEAYSAHTVLPVTLDSVLESVKERCKIDVVEIISVTVDPKVMLGMHRRFKRTYDGVAQDVLQVYYNSSLDRSGQDEMRRLVCCKELLHAYDDQQECATSREAVGRLVEGVAVPPLAHVGPALASDHNGFLLALIVLLPKEAVDHIKSNTNGNTPSVAEIAALAGVPEPYARICFSEFWDELMSKMYSAWGLPPDNA